MNAFIYNYYNRNNLYDITATRYIRDVRHFAWWEVTAATVDDKHSTPLRPWRRRRCQHVVSLGVFRIPTNSASRRIRWSMRLHDAYNVRAIIWQAGFSRDVTHLAFADDPALGERKMIDWTWTSPPMSNVFSIASFSSASSGNRRILRVK